MKYYKFELKSNTLSNRLELNRVLGSRRVKCSRRGYIVVEEKLMVGIENAIAFGRVSVIKSDCDYVDYKTYLSSDKEFGRKKLEATFSHDAERYIATPVAVSAKSLIANLNSISCCRYSDCVSSKE